MTPPIRVLIVSPNGRIYDSLRVLLRAREGLVLVGQAAGSAAGLRLVAEWSPSLVLLSTDLPGDEAWTLLWLLSRCRPQVRCCVLAQNSAEEHRARQMGAYAVLQTGFAAEDLYRLVETVEQEQPMSNQEA